MAPVKRKNIDATVPLTKRILLDQTVGLDTETAEGTNSDYSFNDLPLELMGQVFSYIPGRCWPRLELVSRHFRSGILGTWRNLKNMRLGQFFDTGSVCANDAIRRRRILQSLLRLLHVRSPALESVSGFFVIVQTLDTGSLRHLSQFETLKSVCFAQCRIDALHLADFLATSRSRSCLEELHICDSLGFTAREEIGSSYENSANDRAMQDAVIDKPGRPSLKLKKLVYKANGGSWDKFFTGLDVSVLESLSVAGHPFSMICMAKLLGRCTQLQEFRWSVYSLDWSEHKSLDAFGSLASTKLRKLELNVPYLCVVNEGTVADMLKRIAPLCKRLDTLIIGCNLKRGPGTLINVLCRYFSALETLHLDIEFCDAASLMHLVTRMDRMKRLTFWCKDKSRFAVNSCPQIDSCVLKAIASHMKGLASLCLRGLVVSDESSKILSELEQLKELSVTGPDIPNSAVIGWCKTLGPRLEVLELSSPNISDSSIAICAKDLGHVRRLSLRGTRITDLSLRALSKCGRLERLDLSYCNGITHSGVQAVIDGCKMLVQMKVYETPIKKTVLMCDQRAKALNIIP